MTTSSTRRATADPSTAEVGDVLVYRPRKLKASLWAAAVEVPLPPHPLDPQRHRSERHGGRDRNRVRTLWTAPDPWTAEALALVHTAIAQRLAGQAKPTTTATTTTTHDDNHEEQSNVRDRAKNSDWNDPHDHDDEHPTLAMLAWPPSPDVLIAGELLDERVEDEVGFNFKKFGRALLRNPLVRKAANAAAAYIPYVGPALAKSGGIDMAMAEADRALGKGSKRGQRRLKKIAEHTRRLAQARAKGRAAQARRRRAQRKLRAIKATLRSRRKGGRAGVRKARQLARASRLVRLARARRASRTRSIARGQIRSVVRRAKRGERPALEATGYLAVADTYERRQQQRQRRRERPMPHRPARPDPAYPIMSRREAYSVDDEGQEDELDFVFDDQGEWVDGYPWFDGDDADAFEDDDDEVELWVAGHDYEDDFDFDRDHTEDVIAEWYTPDGDLHDDELRLATDDWYGDLEDEEDLSTSYDPSWWDDVWDRIGARRQPLSESQLIQLLESLRHRRRGFRRLASARRSPARNTSARGSSSRGSSPRGSRWGRNRGPRRLPRRGRSTRAVSTRGKQGRASTRGRTMRSQPSRRRGAQAAKARHAIRAANAHRQRMQKATHAAQRAHQQAKAAERKARSIVKSFLG